MAKMTDLTRRTLGRTGLQVTQLGYGAMELRGAPRGRDVDDEQAERILRAVLDSGINYIDTSIDYGLSEERIGRFIGSRRSEFFLASKCGCVVEPQPAPRQGRQQHVFTRENITTGVEASLEKLRTDYLDVVQFHASPSPDTLRDEGALEALLDLQRAGKVRFLGMSGTLPNLPDQIRMGVFDVFQIPYSAVQSEHEELITEAAAAGAGTVIRGGAAKGGWDGSELDDLLEGASKTEFILRMTLSHPHMHTTIVGTIDPAHLEANIAAARKGTLPAEVQAEARRRLAARALV
jgi:aryl-alcohol dehydrogenase-like predicted oxidoreductase